MRSKATSKHHRSSPRPGERPIPFMKLSGSGNDFILIDNRRGIVGRDRAARLAAKVCAHRLSVGGDGLILIERSRRAHFKWRLFNADGSEADFSGNGARCAARFAFVRRIAPKRMRFETPAGLVEAEIVSGPPDRRSTARPPAVRVRFPDPTGLRLNLRVNVGGVEREAHFIDTGVPHCVYFVDDPESVDLVGVGRPTRYHELFQPAGTNVDFIKVLEPHRIRIRTYERGVEDETLACGTGSIASALVASLVAKVEPPVTVVPESGLQLTVSFTARDGRFSDVYLQGDARTVHEGHILPEAWT